MGQLLFMYAVLKLGTLPFSAETKAMLRDLETQLTAETDRLKVLKRYWRIMGVILAAALLAFLAWGLWVAYSRTMIIPRDDQGAANRADGAVAKWHGSSLCGPRKIVINVPLVPAPRKCPALSTRKDPSAWLDMTAKTAGFARGTIGTPSLGWGASGGGTPDGAPAGRNT
jgi:hypothetical protein